MVVGSCGGLWVVVGGCACFWVFVNLVLKVVSKLVCRWAYLFVSLSLHQSCQCEEEQEEGWR